jgi:hypothetical protein
VRVLLQKAAVERRAFEGTFLARVAGKLQTHRDDLKPFALRRRLVADERVDERRYPRVPPIHLVVCSPVVVEEVLVRGVVRWSSMGVKESIAMLFDVNVRVILM